MTLGLFIIVVMTFLRSFDDLQKFQQNSYRFKRYFRWLNSKNHTYLKPHEVFYILGALLVLFPSSPWLKGLGCLLMVMDYYFFWLIKSAHQAKLKLNVTSRVKRLIFTNTLLLVAIYASWLISGNFFIAVTIALLYPLSFAITMLSNLVNSPIERQINEYYYRDARRILANAPHLTVIGITGSYGKTSTKNVLNQILSKDFNVLMTPESYNTKMGLTRTIRTYLKPTHQVLIAEMGAKEVGDIKELCDFVNPKLGIITSIGPQHLETFKTLENVISTKGELFGNLVSGGTAFVNIDDENILKLPVRDDLKYVRFSTNTEQGQLPINANYSIEDIRLSGNGSSFTLCQTATKRKVRLNTKLLGRHNLSNIVAGVAVALELGVPMDKLNALICDISPIEHRLSYRTVNDTYTLLDDAFNSNPVGSKMALEVLAGFEGNSKIIITPGMIELGSESDALNEQFGRHIAAACDYVILVGRQQTKPIQDGLASADYPSEKLYLATNLSDAFRKLNEIVKKGDVVLIENDLPDTFNEI